MYKTQRRRNVMLCYPFEEKRLAKWEPPYIVQPKLDGVRCRAVRGEDGYKLLSSEENEIISVPHINKILNKLNTRVELDGELYQHHWSFEEIVSVTGRSVNLHEEYWRAEYHVFDIADGTKAQIERLQLLKTIPFVWPIQLVPVEVASTLDDILHIYDRLIEAGYEGIVVRHLMAPYVRKRSTLLMKFKPKKEDTYKVVGYKEEVSIDGKPKDRLGALECISDFGQETFYVGTGFNDDERVELWREREALVGKLAVVGYQHITPGRGVPRFPVYVRLMEI